MTIGSTSPRTDVAHSVATVSALKAKLEAFMMRFTNESREENMKTAVADEY